MEQTTTTTAPEGTPDGEGSATTPDQNGSPEADPIALARKRQAGAEAARLKAQEEAAALRKRLEEYESANRSASDKDLADNAKLQERLAAAEKRAEEAEQKAQARILDALYPNARKELPEVTDEVRLAKFEALLSDPDTEAKTPPPPQNPNESNRVASGDAAGKKPVEKSSADILAELKAGGRPDWL
jgi:hypothetical protein